MGIVCCHIHCKYHVPLPFEVYCANLVRGRGAKRRGRMKGNTLWGTPAIRTDIREKRIGNGS